MSHALKDFLLPDTPFRGLILRGPYCLLAYIGVPQSHWLSDMEALQFECHHSVTFNGPGDGEMRPAGWHWYGWDYGHAGDFVEMPAGFADLVAEVGLDPAHLLSGKRWTIEEVELDIIDVAIRLQASLEKAERLGLAAMRPGRVI